MPHFMLKELMAQPRTWENTMRQLDFEALKLAPFSQILFTGCGSAYYMGLTACELAKDLLQTPCVALPASEIILYPQRHLKDNILMISLSRSGKTSETLEVMRMFKKNRNQVIGFTCRAESPFMHSATHPILLEGIEEESIVQTGSITSMGIGMLALLAHLAGESLAPVHELPAAAEKLLQTHAPLMQSLASPFERVFFLGAGHLKGAAEEAMLKMKEAALTHCDAFHTLEFRHGPSALADEKALIIALVEGHAAECAVLRDMQGQGARVLALSEHPLDLPDSILQVNFGSGLPVWAQTPLYYPLLQLLAYYRAVDKGLNPDKPAHLNPYITLDEVKK